MTLKLLPVRKKHSTFVMANFITCKRFFLDIGRAAVYSLMQHKLRSVLSILGIVCGVMTVLAIMAIGEGARVETLRGIEQMGIRNIYIRADNLTPAQISKSRQHHSRGLQLSDLERLAAASPDIRRTTATRDRVVDPAGFPEHITPQVIETTSEYLSVLGLSMSSGRFIVPLDITNRHRVCVLGWEVSAALGSEGKPGKTLRLGPAVWKIVGVVRKRAVTESENVRVSLTNVNQMIMIPIHAATQADADTGMPLTELIIEIDSAERVPAASTVIRRALQVAHRSVDDFTTVVPFELLAQSRKIQRIFNLVFGSIGGLSLAIGGIGIMNIMLASVSERVREIGLRRAVGAQPYHIIVQFVVEAVILTGVGGVLGIAGGAGLAAIISAVAGWPVYFSAAILTVPLALAVLTGGFFGLYPAVKASRMDPLKALGYVA